MSFTLRTAFVQLLQAKAFLTLAQQNLTDYDQFLGLSRDRFQAGDISQVDLDRLQLQRVQYESDLQTATVNVRTAKIQLLQLMNEQTTTVEAFDVTGPYDFAEPTRSLADLRQLALLGAARPAGGPPVDRQGQGRLPARGGQRNHRSGYRRHRRVAAAA